MACSDYSSGIELGFEALKKLKFFDAVYCWFYQSLGTAGTGLVVFAPVALGFAVYYRSPAPLVVLFAVLAVAFASEVPAIGVTIAMLVLVLGTAVAVAAMYRRIRTP